MAGGVPSKENLFAQYAVNSPSSAAGSAMVEIRVVKGHESLHACQKAYAHTHSQCFPVETPIPLVEQKLRIFLKKGFEIQTDQLGKALSPTLSLTQGHTIFLEQKALWAISLATFQKQFDFLR